MEYLWKYSIWKYVSKTVQITFQKAKIKLIKKENTELNLET